jgi:hypothetical protein
MKKVMQDGETAARMVVARAVVTIAGMTAADDDAVSATLKCLDYEKGIDPAATGKFYDSYIGVHFEAACARQIGSRVGTPVTDKSYNLGRPGLVGLTFYLNRHDKPRDKGEK